MCAKSHIWVEHRLIDRNILNLCTRTAREKVRVAHALKTLPLVSEAFSSGELSYAKVRAMTRVAHRALRIRRDAERGMMIITVELPVDAGQLAEKALDKARDDEALGIPDIADTSWSTRQADAFVNLVTGYPSGGDDAENDNHLITVHVEQSALCGAEGRAGLPIESVKRLCCDSHALVITEDSSCEPLSIGRKSRIIPKAISRAVRARDNNCCTFPGCRNQRFLNCHHVEH